MTITLRPKDLKDAIEAIIMAKEHHTPLFIWGPPGIGKSSIVRQAAEALAIGFRDVRMTLLDPTDLRGIPIPDNGIARWLAPSFLPRADVDGKEGILFLDELNAAPPLVQASGYQLVLDRAVGEYKLPDGWAIIAAGNRQGDRAVVHRMPSPLANRFIHLDLEVNTEDWTDWAITHKVAHQVIGFINFRPDLLFAFDALKDERAFPTPRSWEKVSAIMALEKPNILSAMVAGAVGEGAAAEYLQFLRVYTKLPDIDAILNGGMTVPEPKDIKYATVTACAMKASSRHVDHLVKYSLKYPAEFAVLMVKLLQVQHLDAIFASPTFRREWIQEYKALINIS